MANGEWNEKFSPEQILLNERLAAYNDRIDRMMISQETMDKIQQLAETDRVKQLVEEFEASPSAQGVLKAFADANAKLDSILDSKEMRVLKELADAQAKGATDSELMAMAQAKGALATIDIGQTNGAADSASRAMAMAQNTMLGYLAKVGNQGALKNVDYNEESDGLVFSYLAYVSKFIRDLSRADEESVFFIEATELKENETIGSYVDRLLKWIASNPDAEISENDRLFLESLKKCGRYKDLEFAYIDYGREDGSIQDLVIAIKYDDGGIAVAFEGTDGTYNGWSTNRDLLLADASPAEKWAMEQLETILREYGGNGPVDVSGHSRGGHLAISSLILLHTSESDVKVNPNIIRSVTAFDAPGFHKDFIAQYSVIIGQYSHLIHNYYITNSAIGMIGEPIGDGTFIGMALEKPIGASHDAYCWAVDDNGYFIVTDQASESRLVQEFLRYALNTLTDEEVGAFFDAILQTLRTGVDGEYIGDGMFDEGASLDQIISGLLERIENSGVLDVAGETLAKLMLNHPATEFIGKVKDIVSTTKNVTALLAKIPVLTPYLEPVVAALQVVEVILTVIDFTLQAIYVIHKLKQENRINAYISNNPVISFRFSDMDSIAHKLANANKCIERAGNSFVALGNQKYWRYELADVLTLGFTVLLDAISWFGLRLQTGGRNRNIDKMRNATQDIRALWKSGCSEISSQLQVGGSDNELTVNPTALSQYAKNMGDELQKAEVQYGNTVDAIYALGAKQQWSNDDYDQFKKDVKTQEPKILSNIRGVKSTCGAMEGVAVKYGSMQKDSITICDDAIHNWWSDFLFW